MTSPEHEHAAYINAYHAVLNGLPFLLVPRPSVITLPVTPNYVTIMKCSALVQRRLPEGARLHFLSGTGQFTFNNCGAFFVGCQAKGPQPAEAGRSPACTMIVAELPSQVRGMLQQRSSTMKYPEVADHIHKFSSIEIPEGVAGEIGR